MKKLFSVAAAMAFALALAAGASAGKPEDPGNFAPRERTTVSGTSYGPSKSAQPAGKNTGEKSPRRRQITGIVEAVDGAAGTLTVKGRHGSVSLKAGEKVRLEGIEVGDRVISRYSAGTAFRVQKIGARRASGGKK